MRVGEMYYYPGGDKNINSYLIVCAIKENYFDYIGYYGEDRIWYGQFNKDYKLLTNIFVDE